MFGRAHLQIYQICKYICFLASFLKQDGVNFGKNRLSVVSCRTALIRWQSYAILMEGSDRTLFVSFFWALISSEVILLLLMLLNLHDGNICTARKRTFTHVKTHGYGLLTGLNMSMLTAGQHKQCWTGQHEQHCQQCCSATITSWNTHVNNRERGHGPVKEN